MPNNFVTPFINFAKKLGGNDPDNNAPVRYRPTSSTDELNTVIRAIYRQVLDNAHVMESERLQSPEAQFQQGQLTVVELIRQIAKSDLYRTRFFENSSSTRFIELNFKHFLGRAPENSAEIVHYSAILENDGYEAVIDAYLDSDEYRQAFGEETVPYARDYKTGVAAKSVAPSSDSQTQSLFAGQVSQGGTALSVAAVDQWLKANARSVAAASSPTVAVASEPVMPVAVRSPYAPTAPIQPAAAKLRANFSTLKPFINPVVNPDQPLGVSAFVNVDPVRRFPTSSTDELDRVIRAVYKQVLSNAHVMESERLSVPESQFRRGEINVIEFIRQVAHSDMYRSRFFENGPRNRFIELNFKHFLGRAPESLAEIALHSAILDKEGYEAEIDSYLDSDEYYQNFGSDTVPFYRGYKTEAVTMAGFTHMFSLLRGASSSDKNVTENNPARLVRSLFAAEPSNIVSPSGAIARKIDQTATEILRNLFSRSAVSDGAAASSAVEEAPVESELATKARSQAETIAALEAQLADIRPFSSMGSAIVRKGQRPVLAGAEPAFGATLVSVAGSVGTSENAPEDMLAQQVADQALQIEKLQGELMSAQSLVNVADYRLNKWRLRSY